MSSLLYVPVVQTRTIFSTVEAATSELTDASTSTSCKSIPLRLHPIYGVTSTPLVLIDLKEDIIFGFHGLVFQGCVSGRLTLMLLTQDGAPDATGKSDFDE